MRRIPNLDLFRFIAISAVIYYHVSQRFLRAFYTDIRLIDVGAFGVELFFVLSGFLIGSIYFKNAGPVNLFKFWLRRFVRTYPPYLVTLCIYFVSAYLVRKQSFDLAYFLLLQNFYQVMPLFTISWSLCVEEHFYLVFPVIVLITDRWIQHKKFALFFWIVICVLPTFLRYQLGFYNTREWGYYVTASIFRFDGIAMGCLLAFIVNRYNLAKWRSNHVINIILALGSVALAYWLTGTPTLLKYTLGYLFLVINIGLLLLSFYLSADIAASKMFAVKQVAAMAYSLYLTHALVINFFSMLSHKLNIAGYLTAPLCLFFIFFSGKIFYIFIERKSIDLKNRLVGHH